MANDYYNKTGNPLPVSRALSALARNESALVEAGFAKLPAASEVFGGQSNFYVDTGAASALIVASLDPSITALTDGLELVIRVANDAIGPSTIVAGTFPIKQIRIFDGSVISASDFAKDQFISIRYDATNDWFQYSGNSTTTAQAAAASAAASAAAAAATAGAAPWVSGTNYAQYDAAISPSSFLTYRRKVSGVSTVDPALDPNGWQSINGLSQAQLWAAALSFS